MKIKTENNKEYIFDVVRKKYVLNQPEEWVRQNIIKFLNEKKGYPISLMSVEKKTKVNNSKKRCDIICHNSSGNPLLLIECKANEIDDTAFDQSVNYQNMVKAKYIIITNGKNHYCFKIQNRKLIFSKRIPTYSELNH